MVDDTRSVPHYSFQLGDRVQIRHYAGKPGRIVELRGALGPGGAPIYRVLVRRRPTPISIEVRGDQLVAAPKAAAAVRGRAIVKADDARTRD